MDGSHLRRVHRFLLGQHKGLILSRSATRPDLTSSVKIAVTAISFYCRYLITGAKMTLTYLPEPKLYSVTVMVPFIPSWPLPQKLSQ